MASDTSSPTGADVRVAGRLAANAPDPAEHSGPTGHILSPIDNITQDTPQAWHNIDTFIDELKRHRPSPS